MQKHRFIARRAVATAALGASLLVPQALGSAQEATATGHSAAHSSSTGKSALRVLLVSHNPKELLGGLAQLEEGDRQIELFTTRAAEFNVLLSEHFESVRLVYAADYTPALSDAVDVTLFDAMPKPLRDAVRGTDPETGEATYEPAQYLPDDFDRAAVMIADNSPRLGETLGTKLDWL